MNRIRTGYSFDDVLLVPQRTSVRSRADVDVATQLFGGLRLRAPVVSANTQWCTGGRMASAMAFAGGLGIIHRMQTVDQQTAQVKEVKETRPHETGGQPTLAPDGTLATGAAVGTVGDYRERAGKLVDAGVDVLLVDVAHGHADSVLEVVAELRSEYPALPIAVGNVATASGVRDLAEAGADTVKVGIGPGGVCTTRLVAGSGVPQMTAILDCADAAREAGVTLIADGGIRRSGDIAKALAGGAHAVMLGSALAGCDESAALLVEDGDHSYKVSRGFASLGMANTLLLSEGKKLTHSQVENYVAEGVETTFRATGPVADTLHQLMGGVRSGMSYSGARTLDEFQAKAEFIHVTAVGQAENHPHSLERAPHEAPDYRAEAVRGR